MKNKLLVITTALCILPLLYGAMLYQGLAEYVPVNWGAGGVRDTIHKAYFVFALPVGAAIGNILIATVLDRPRNHGQLNPFMVMVSKWMMPIMVNLLFPLSILVSKGYQFNLTLSVPMVVGLLLVLIGNYLPRCHPSQIFSIKTPWALRNRENWIKTHQIGGWSFVVCGLILILNSFVSQSMGLLLWVLPALVVPVIYSYLLSKKQSS